MEISHPARDNDADPNFSSASGLSVALLLDSPFPFLVDSPIANMPQKVYVTYNQVRHLVLMSSATAWRGSNYPAWECMRS